MIDVQLTRAELNTLLMSVSTEIERTRLQHSKSDDYTLKSAYEKSLFELNTLHAYLEGKLFLSKSIEL